MNLCNGLRKNFLKNEFTFMTRCLKEGGYMSATEPDKKTNNSFEIVKENTN